MAFNRNFPHQKAFKRFSLREIHKLIVEKESQGWEMVRPIFKETIRDKGFRYETGNKTPWKYAGDTHLEKWVAVMTKKEREVG